MNGFALLLGLVVALWLVPVSVFAADVLQLNIPIGNTSAVAGLGEYIGVFYQYFVGVIGILAVAMIMFGGYKWIVASGNQQHIQSAKDTITAAVMGVILALISYVLLNLINPGLVSLRVVIPGLSVPPAVVYDAATKTYTYVHKVSLCENIPTVENGKKSIRGFSEATIGDSSQLNQYINKYAASYPGLPQLVKAILKKESDFVTNRHSTCKKYPGEPCACGIAQFLPETAYQFNALCDLEMSAPPDPQSAEYKKWRLTECTNLKKHPEGSICAAARYLREQLTSTGNATSAVAAYNAGAGALAPSVCCPGLQKWQCPIDCIGGIETENTGYKETRQYVETVAKYVRQMCDESGES